MTSKSAWGSGGRPPKKPPPPVQAKHLAVGMFVMVPGGRVGMIETLGIYLTRVKFGPDGPIHQYPWKALREATYEEICRAGLDGVGHA